MMEQSFYNFLFARCERFAQEIRQDLPSPCDELAGFRATYLANRAIASIELKQTLPVPLEKITPCI